MISQKRQELATGEKVEDLIDYLYPLEARAKIPRNPVSAYRLLLRLHFV